MITHILAMIEMTGTTYSDVISHQKSFIMPGALREKDIIHQVTTMLATSKTVLFPGHKHLLTTGADAPTPWLLLECQQEIWRWLHGG